MYAAARVGVVAGVEEITAQIAAKFSCELDSQIDSNYCSHSSVNGSSCKVNSNRQWSRPEFSIPYDTLWRRMGCQPRHAFTECQGAVILLSEAYLPSLGPKPLSATVQGAHEMLIHREATGGYMFMARTSHSSSVHSSTGDYMAISPYVLLGRSLKVLRFCRCLAPTPTYLTWTADIVRSRLKLFIWTFTGFHGALCAAGEFPGVLTHCDSPNILSF